MALDEKALRELADLAPPRNVVPDRITITVKRDGSIEGWCPYMAAVFKDCPLGRDVPEACRECYCG